MKSLKNTIIYGILACLIIPACVNPPDYPEVPEISYVSMSSNIMNQGFGGNLDDFTVITFSFQDGDGDLGDTLNNVFLFDKRDGVQSHSFKIPFIPQQGAASGISGEVSIEVPTTCCITENNPIPCEPDPLDPVDTLIYEIQIMDRAGNMSNKVETAPIFLQCN